MAESQIGGQELTVKGGVTLLGRGELLGEKTKGKPGPANQLLEDGANVGGGGVHSEERPGRRRKGGPGGQLHFLPLLDHLHVCLYCPV